MFAVGCSFFFMPTVELGARLIDDYGAFFRNKGVTLSLVDLREIPKLYQAYAAYSQNAKEYISSDRGFRQISRAREDSRSYADGENEQIDLADYISQTSVSGGEDLLRMVQKEREGDLDVRTQPFYAVNMKPVFIAEKQMDAVVDVAHGNAVMGRMIFFLSRICPDSAERFVHFLNGFCINADPVVFYMDDQIGFSHFK